MRPPPATPPPRPVARPTHLGWRLLAIVYDLVPLAGIVFAMAALNLLLRGGSPVQPGSPGAWVELATMLLAAFFYLGLSWRRGGQTLGMRAWRLRLVTTEGGVPSWRALTVRYAVAFASWGACGLGFLWSLFDGERRTWHDIASRTAIVRLQKPAKR